MCKRSVIIKINDRSHADDHMGLFSITPPNVHSSCEANICLFISLTSQDVIGPTFILLGVSSFMLGKDSRCLENGQFQWSQLGSMTTQGWLINQNIWIWIMRNQRNIRPILKETAGPKWLSDTELIKNFYAVNTLRFTK